MYYFVYLPGHPWEWAAFVDGHGSALRDLATVVLRTARSSLDQVEARLDVGQSSHADSAWLVPLTWDAPGIFRHLSGDIHLDTLDPATTQMTMRASYKLDWDEDPAAAHRMVELIVKHFLEGIETLAETGRFDA